MQQIKITLAVGEVSILHKSMTVTHKTIRNKLYHQVVVHGCIRVAVQKGPILQHIQYIFSHNGLSQNYVDVR
jgi:hypothetical protein